MRLAITAPTSHTLDAVSLHWTYGSTLWLQRPVDDDGHAFDLHYPPDRARLLGAEAAAPTHYTLDNVTAPARFVLLHGRDSADEELEDWGFEGSTFPVTRVAVAPIGITLTAPDGSETFLPITGDLIVHEGKFYGDAAVSYIGA